MLDLIANQLHDLGYRHMRADSLKPKHVEALVERWKADGLSVGTIKNRMAALRWWAEKIGKQNVIARDNDAYGIERRQYVTNVSKGKDLDPGEAGPDHRPVHAHVAQAAGGLRAAPRGVDQDPPGLGRPGERARAQGHLDQGRARPRDPDPHRCPARQSWTRRSASPTAGA